MRIYPAIDLLNNQCVRLTRGNFLEKTVYSNNPLQTAQLYAEQGARYLHIVNLKGALEEGEIDFTLIKKIIESTSLQVQFGGGIRDTKTAEKLFKINVDRIILGSLAIEDPVLIKNWLYHFGPEKIVLGLDIVSNKVAIRGWKEKTQLSLFNVVERYAEAGLRHVLCTDIDKDGTLKGPNFQLYQEAKLKFPSIQWIASGGIASLSDLVQLATDSLSAAIIGKALYEESFCLREVFSCLPNE